MNSFEKFLLAEAGAFIPGLLVATTGQLVQAFGLPDLEVFSSLDQQYMSQDFISRGEFSMKFAPAIIALGAFLYFVGSMWHHNTDHSLNERHE